MHSTQRVTTLVIPVPATDDRWTLDEETMPESRLHDLAVELILQVLRAWVLRKKRDAIVGKNLAIRWDRAHANRGVDPDVYLVEPTPPEGDALTSLCLWKKGHHPPRVCVEVVSENTATKDYADGPARHGASGARELWVFDPLLLGPSPVVLQLWRRTGKGSFERVYAGSGPAYSRELRAWLVVTDEGMRLRVSDDAPGRALWPTQDEEERAEKEQERRARVAAETEVARLRALLAAQGAPTAPAGTPVRRKKPAR